MNSVTPEAGIRRTDRERCVAIPWMLLLAGMLLAAPMTAAPDQAPARPNVVVFLADDAGWGDYGFNGNPDVATPRMDSIGEQGASFDYFYVQPVCSPTRAEFLTGRWFPRGFVTGTSAGEERLNLGTATVAEAFQQAGYATGCFGKWHNGSQWPYHPMARGFDEYMGHTSGHWGEYFDAPLEHNGRMIRTEGYIVDVCTGHAVDFIRRHADRPFLVYLPFTTPHSPWSVPDDYWERWKDRTPAGLPPDADETTIDMARCALAMMENMDDNVGRVLDTLAELGLEDNTIVVYFTDNGPNSARFNGGLRGRKGSVDEGGVKSPLWIRWPAAIEPGTRVAPVAGAIDLLPTLCALAGVEPTGEQALDGIDLSPMLLGGAGARIPALDDRVLIQAWRDRISARSGEFRLGQDGGLYRVTTDPGQQHDLAARHPEEVRRLRSAIDHYQREVLEGNDHRQPDRRPFPVGFGGGGFPWTMLPARDGTAGGGIERSNRFPNCTYFTGWTSTEDTIVWPVEVGTAGRYRVVIDYTCAAGDEGSVIELAFGDARLRGSVGPAWDPPLIDDQDRVPRQEGYMKEFRPLELGEIELPQGAGELVLRALEIPGDTVMELRRLNLTLVAE